MDWVFDPHAWSTLKTYLGHGESSSSSTSETSLLKRQQQETFNLKQISEHVFELSRNPERPSVEIIFFHGLQVDSSSEPYITSWLSRDGSQLWLNWLLEEFPDARVLVVSYDASIRKTDNHGRLDMYLTCENLVQELMQKRKAPVGETGCPIILVGHCLGGLVLKELCVKVSHRMMTEEDDSFRNFLQSVKGVFCYSSPHHGSEFPDRNTLRARGPLFEDLNPLNAKTARQNEDFRKLRNKQKWRSAGVGEGLEVTLNNLRGLVVPEGSSRHDMDTYYTIMADHFDVCRPDSPVSPSYTLLADLVDQIIRKDIGSVVSNNDLPDIFVGFDSHIKAVQDKLSMESRIALVGMGGIGKTTLARAVYEKIQKSFDYSCFFREVKTLMEPKVTAQELRNKIQKQFVDRGGRMVPEGFTWNLLEGKKVLIVLDDTISKEQLKVMTPKDGFSIGSRLIITARCKGFIGSANLGFCIHPVEVLDRDSSKELLCRCSFGKKESPTYFFEHVEKIVTKCGGLPLALTITGSFLFSKRKPEWEDAFKRLEAAESLNGDAEDGLFSLLKISYDSLAKREKEMFLDVKTCFHGKYLEEVVKTWKYCGWADSIGWGNLLERHLVEEQDGKIFVHEILRDLGRNIARRSRMLMSNLNELSNEDANAVKIVSGHVDDFEGSLLNRLSRLKVLWLDVFDKDESDEDESYEDESDEDESYEDESDEDESDENESDKESDKESDEDARDDRGQGVESTSPMIMDLSALTEMSVVSLMGIKDIMILRSIFTVKSLQSLNLKAALPWTDKIILGTLWAEIGQLKNLQLLDISYCDSLRAIPREIGQLRNLQSLDISHCKSLRAIPIEIGQLRNLQSLDISHCKSVRAIPTEIGELKNLQSLNISHCHKLREIPTEIGELKNLQWFEISPCHNLRAIPIEIGELKKLQSLDISYYSKLKAIPIEIGQLKNLESLEISHCSNLKTIPIEIGKLKNLKLLDISECSSLGTIPIEIGKLKNLQSLDISKCSNLGAIPIEIGQLKNLQLLNMKGCSNLEAIPIEIGQLENLELLNISDCLNLRAIPIEIGQLKNLQSLDITECCYLQTIPIEIGQLKNLQSLDIRGCYSLRTILIEIGQLENLQSLDLTWCKNLDAIPTEIGQLKNLQSLNIRRCSGLETIPTEIGQLENLQLLDISKCFGLETIPIEIGQLKNLQSLMMSQCQNLEAIPIEIGQLKNLLSLDIRKCFNLRAIPIEIGQLKNLELLEILFCRDLRAIPIEIGQLKNLQSLTITLCSSLGAIPIEIGQLENLEFENNPDRNWPIEELIVIGH